MAAFIITALVVGGFLLIVFFYVRSVQSAPRYSPFTEDFLREPGETLRNQREKLLSDLMDPMLVITALLASVPLVASLIKPPINLIIVLILIVALAYESRKAKKMLDQMMRIRLGMEGERATGQELSLLMREGAWVFHDLPYIYGNIDHIVVAKGGVFAIETKAVSKPTSSSTGRPEATVEYDGRFLKFPHKEDNDSIEQAKRHAKYLHRHIKEKLGLHVVVTPVVALPGWFVEWKGASDVWVINPKRGYYLKKAVNKGVLKPDEVARIASHLESVARSVRPGSKKLDPNASEHYDFWMNPKYKPPAVE